jgi:hypothetical protein
MHDADIAAHGYQLDSGLYPRPVAFSARFGVMGAANRERNRRALFLREERKDEAPRDRRVPTRPRSRWIWQGRGRIRPPAEPRVSSD